MGFQTNLIQKFRTVPTTRETWIKLRKIRFKNGRTLEIKLESSDQITDQLL